jgi:acetyl-CoA acyltransferase 1
MLSHVLRAAYTQPGLDPALIEDVAVGTVLQAGSGAGTSRMAALHAGIPYTTSLNTVNRQCSSGLSTVNQIANQIKAGQIDIGIGSFASCLIMWFVFKFLSRCWRGINDDGLWSRRPTIIVFR